MFGSSTKDLFSQKCITIRRFDYNGKIYGRPCVNNIIISQYFKRLNDNIIIIMQWLYREWKETRQRTDIIMIYNNQRNGKKKTIINYYYYLYYIMRRAVRCDYIIRVTVWFDTLPPFNAKVRYGVTTNRRRHRSPTFSDFHHKVL